MKIKDLEKAERDGTTLAYVSFSSDGINANYAQKVKVIKARATRQVSSGRSWHTHSAPGVTVEFLDGPKGETLLGHGRRETVALTRVVGTWNEWEIRRMERQKAEQQREQRQTMSKEHAEAAAARVTARLDAAGKKYAYNAVEVVGIGGGRAPYAYAVRIAPELVEWLIDGV